MPQDRNVALPDVARCSGCQWEGGNHDELLTMFEDATVLRRVVSSQVDDEYGELEDEHGSRNGGCAAVDIPEFIRQHNWPDPAMASFFAGDLEALSEAYRARRDQRRDLESRVAADI